VDKKTKKRLSVSKKKVRLRPETRALIFEYVTNLENVKLRTKDIAKAVGLSERHTLRFLTPEFWEESLVERRKKYKKHAHFVDEGLVRSAAKGNPQAAKLFYERFEGWAPKQKHEHTGKDGDPIEQKVTIYLPENKRDK
jgi:hypothetical protein